MKKLVLLLLGAFIISLTTTTASKKIELKGKLIVTPIKSTPLPFLKITSSGNIVDYVQAYIDEKTIYVEFVNQILTTVTISVLKNNGEVVIVKEGLVTPEFEQINLDNCENGEYILLIEDFANISVYGYFELE